MLHLHQCLQRCYIVNARQPPNGACPLQPAGPAVQHECSRAPQGQRTCPPPYFVTPPCARLHAEQLAASLSPIPASLSHTPPPPPLCLTACTACRMLAWACRHLDPLARLSQHMLPCWSKACPSCSCWELILEALHPAGRRIKLPKTGCMAFWKHLLRSVPPLGACFCVSLSVCLSPSLSVCLCLCISVHPHACLLISG